MCHPGACPEELLMRDDLPVRQVQEGRVFARMDTKKAIIERINHVFAFLRSRVARQTCGLTRCTDERNQGVPILCGVGRFAAVVPFDDHVQQISQKTHSAPLMA